MGQPWENHGKMMIYMERSTISGKDPTISTGPWLQVRCLCLFSLWLHHRHNMGNP